MRVGMKIALGFLVVIVIMLAMGGTSFYSAGNVADQVGGVERASQRMELAGFLSGTDRALSHICNGNLSVQTVLSYISDFAV